MNSSDRPIVLIVDDDEDMREVMEMTLESKGFQVVEAEEGEAALKVLDSQKVDVVISDLNMPNISGIDLLKKIREKDVSYPPFIFLSGDTSRELDDLYSYGAFNYVTKPFDLKIFFNMVKKAAQVGDSDWINDPDLSANRGKLSCHSNFIDRFDIKQPDTALVGRGGIFIPGFEGYPELGGLYEVVLSISDGPFSQFEFIGEVAWVRYDESDSLLKGVGIKFRSMNEENLGKIEKILDGEKLSSFIPVGSKAS